MEKPDSIAPSLRSCISQDKREIVVFATDVLAQPHYAKLLRDVEPYIYTKCSRALVTAEADDVVVLSGKLDRDYYRWLKNLGLGPDHVVEYDTKDPAVPLSELIVLNPEPLLETIARTGKKPIYVPFYSGRTEQRAADAIRAELFGCEESITLRYFDKESFKNECGGLGIPMVNGSCHRISGMKNKKFASLVSNLLRSYPSVIIRGSLGSAGSSAYRVDGPDIKNIIRQIRESNDTDVLIEPFLNVIASPNDQWIIDRNGEPYPLGVSAQLFKGLKHIGNLRGQYFSKHIYDYIRSASAKIVSSMAADGYRGFLGIDYIVTTEGIFPIENNARMNGSSFAIGLVDKLQQRHQHKLYWKFFKAKLESCSFPELLERLGSFVYDATQVNSVFPFDCDMLAHTGVFTPIIVAEDLYHIEFLSNALKELGVEKV